MFTPEERDSIRSEVLAAAGRDARISGGAITGSAGIDRQDRWSDLDLAFGVRDAGSISAVLSDYTERMYARHGALHHLDVASGTWIYRVFLLASTLQVDLAFAPERDFGARAPTFKLVFGAASPIPHDPPPQGEAIVGWAWLYALHTRSCIERGKVWQAEYMISRMRDQLISLLCLRHGLPAREGRGVDRLPEEPKRRLEGCLVTSLDAQGLGSAFRAVTEILCEEVALLDGGLARRLCPALNSLAGMG